MKYEIPYLSKEKNPHAGRTVYHRPVGPEQIEVRTKVMLPELEGFHLRWWQSIDGEDDVSCIYQVVCADNLKAFEDLGLDEVEIDRVMPHQTVYSITPEPAHLYRYDSTFEIQCCECNASFPWVELRDNDDCIYGNEWDPAYNDEICPECGEYDCCEFSFQK